MAAGAKPSLDPSLDPKTGAQKAPETKPASLKDRILKKLSQVFEHNERLGSTR